MKKTFGFVKITVMAVMGFFLFLSTAWSTSIEYTPVADGLNTGSLLYMATAGSGRGVQGNFGNDLPANVEEVLRAGYMFGDGWSPGTVWYSNETIWTGNLGYFGSIDVVMADKAENVGGGNAVTGENGILTVEGNQWSVSGAAVEFYALKDAQAYALYWLDPSVSNGIWDPGDLRALGFGSDVEISHLSVFNSTTQQVTEPAIMFLMGAGLLGIATFGRRRRSSKQ